MCGRFAILKADEEYIQYMRDVMKAARPRMKERFNVCPSQDVHILRFWDGKPKWDEVRWLLYEAWWAKMENPRGPQMNARSDKVFKIAMYKHSMLKRRCLIPATGWYEWNKKKKSLPPHFIRKKDGSAVMFGGIWSTYHSDEKKLHQDNFAIITTEAHKIIQPFHDRMPVIIKPDDYEKWLDPENKNVAWLEKRLEPYKGRDLEAFYVSHFVNNVRNQGKECIKPHPEQSDLFAR